MSAIIKYIDEVLSAKTSFGAVSEGDERIMILLKDQLCQASPNYETAKLLSSAMVDRTLRDKLLVSFDKVDLETRVSTAGKHAQFAPTMEQVVEFDSSKPPAHVSNSFSFLGEAVSSSSPIAASSSSRTETRDPAVVAWLRTHGTPRCYDDVVAAEKALNLLDISEADNDLLDGVVSDSYRVYPMPDGVDSDEEEAEKGVLEKEAVLVSSKLGVPEQKAHGIPYGKQSRNDNMGRDKYRPLYVDDSTTFTVENYCARVPGFTYKDGVLSSDDDIPDHDYSDVSYRASGRNFIDIPERSVVSAIRVSDADYRRQQELAASQFA